MLYTCFYKSPLGSITMASDGTALTGLWFDGQKYFAEGLTETAAAKTLPVFDEAVRWLDIYFGGRRPDFTPPLNLEKGTAFRKEVWQQLLQIPYGKTTTYGKLAAQIAAKHGQKRMSAQAVGSAVGHNPISIIVPCHRVVGTSGSLTGYAGGLAKKLALLKLEGIDTAKFTMPAKGTAL